MDDALRTLIGLAWKTVPAREANDAIARARRAAAAGEAELAAAPEGASPTEDDDGEGPMARSYELLLAPTATLASFAQSQLPRLVYHLESIGAHLPHAGGVLLCVFEGENLHFLHTGEFVAAAAQALGLSVEQLVEKHGTGESRTAVRGPPLLLS
jgi:hypothetical protein